MKLLVKGERVPGKGPCGLQSNQSYILLQHHSHQKGVERSWIHVCQFLNKGKEGWCGRHHGFSMLEVGVGDM